MEPLRSPQPRPASTGAPRFSLYLQGRNSPVPDGYLTLADWERMAARPGPDLIARTMKARGAGTPDERRARAEQLPACTPAGVFLVQRPNWLVASSGLHLIECSDVPDPDAAWEAMMGDSGLADRVLMVGSNLSGWGLRMLVAVEPGSARATDFDLLTSYLAFRYGHLGLVVNRRGRDPLWQVPLFADPGIWFNPHFGRCGATVRH